MGQKINPVGLRLGIVRGWDSNWFGGKTFSDKLVEDQKIRKYIDARIQKGGIAKVVIERTIKRITLTIHTARPGVVIGKGGTEVDKIKEELKVPIYLGCGPNDTESKKESELVKHFFLTLSQEPEHERSPHSG
jgi:ribosomal protein S3